ncbi:MAG: hypothetical protein IT360_12065 [Gemmatimonadaceae bacterium]|nr:hypothetical protein [Gemmatimonadaceae bacterium]
MTHALVRVLMVAAIVPISLMAQPSTSPLSDVRQIVTFRFLPGRGDSALAIYQRELVPLYRANAAMRRFRGFREAESPEPLDLVVVSSFDGMAGMDDSNVALRGLSSGGRSVFQWYGALSDLSQQHHDQFVEMLPDLGDVDAAAVDSAGGLVVMEYVRLSPGNRRAFERTVGARVRAVERARGLVRWSETGRLLVSDGWDYVRLIGIASLASWQAYGHAMDASGVTDDLDRLVVARKTIIVRQVPGLSVR